MAYTSELFLGLANGTPDLGFLYGNPGDMGFAGDWDGDGVDTIGIARPAARGAQFYLRNSNTTDIGDVVLAPFGPPAGTPLHGRFGLG